MKGVFQKLFFVFEKGGGGDGLQDGRLVIGVLDYRESADNGSILDDLLRRVPNDPMVKSADWGMRSYQDTYDSRFWGRQNVYDVYSKSNAIAIDGTKYSDW